MIIEIPIEAHKLYELCEPVGTMSYITIKEYDNSYFAVGGSGYGMAMIEVKLMNDDLIENLVIPSNIWKEITDKLKLYKLNTFEIFRETVPPETEIDVETQQIVIYIHSNGYAFKTISPVGNPTYPPFIDFLSKDKVKQETTAIQLGKYTAPFVKFMCNTKQDFTIRFTTSTGNKTGISIWENIGSDDRIIGIAAISYKGEINENQV